MKCGKCGSDSLIKAGGTNSVIPKQKWYCKSCHRFSVSNKNRGD